MFKKIILSLLIFLSFGFLNQTYAFSGTYNDFLFSDINSSEFSFDSNFVLTPSTSSGSIHVLDYTSHFNVQNVLLYNIFIILSIVGIFQIVGVLYPIINDFLGKK